MSDTDQTVPPTTTIPTAPTTTPPSGAPDLKAQLVSFACALIDHADEPGKAQDGINGVAEAHIKAALRKVGYGLLSALGAKK